MQRLGYSFAGVVFQLIFIAQGSAIFGASAEGSASEPRTGFTLVQSGPHERHWIRKGASGADASDGTSRYVELGTGTFYRNHAQQKWEASEPRWLIDPARLVRSTKAHYQVSLKAHNEQLTVSLSAAGVPPIQSTLLGLALYDEASGRTLLIGRWKRVAGVIPTEAPYQIYFPDCFDGVKADLVYEIGKAYIAQDIILREAPDISGAGFDPATCRIELWTEFLSPPRYQQIRTTRAAHLINSNVVDDHSISMGSVVYGPGKAFLQRENQSLGARLRSGTSIQKSVQVIDGRTFLIESVSVRALEAMLDQLTAAGPSRPQSSARRLNRRELVASFSPGSTESVSPSPVPRSHSDRQAIEIAKIGSLPITKGPGVVLDYTAVIGTHDFTFRGDTTYWITAPVYLTGTTTIEGGSIIKLSPDPDVHIAFYGGSIDCRTTPLQPAIITSQHDNFFGETLPDSTAVPEAASVGFPALWVLTSGQELHNLRILYAAKGISFYSDTDNHSVKNVQILHTGTAFEAFGNSSIGMPNNFRVGNALLYQIRTAVVGEMALGAFSHLTLNGCGTLCADSTGTSSLRIENSLLSSISAFGDGLVSTTHSEFVEGSAFSGAGGGLHYLSATSPHLSAGKPTTEEGVLNGSTDPPVFLASSITEPTFLRPRARRSNPLHPDLGYHYPRVDYLANNTALYSRLWLSGGVRVAGYGTFGIRLYPGASVESLGTPLDLNSFTRHMNVQEQPSPWTGSESSSYFFLPAGSDTTGRRLSARFTQFSALQTWSMPHYHLYSSSSASYVISEITLRDCAFYGGRSLLGGVSTGRVRLFNSLFENSRSYLYYYPALSLINNHFHGGWCGFYRLSSEPWLANDNAFDQCALADYKGGIIHGHNAYFSITGRRLQPESQTDQVLQVRPWLTGPLGRYYQSSTSPLKNAGSRSAPEAGLFHYTTSVDESKEAHSQIDIGLHYVSTSHSHGYDTDADGLADYREDTDGDGTLTGSDGVGDWDQDGTRDSRDGDPLNPDVGEMVIRILTPRTPLVLP